MKCLCTHPLTLPDAHSATNSTGVFFGRDEALLGVGSIVVDPVVQNLSISFHKYMW